MLTKTKNKIVLLIFTVHLILSGINLKDSFAALQQNQIPGKSPGMYYLYNTVDNDNYIIIDVDTQKKVHNPAFSFNRNYESSILKYITNCKTTHNYLIQQTNLHFPILAYKFSPNKYTADF